MQLELQQYADEKIENDVVDYVGMIAGVDTPACGIQVVATGLANVDPETPMSPEHMLPVASITKTFVGTRVLQLVDEGVLSLDDTLSTWRTDVPNADSITIRHLLGHRSGLLDYPMPCKAEALSDPEREWTIEELIDCMNGYEAVCLPGQCYEYSSYGFMLLGYIVEMVTGNALHEEVRAHVLTPLGLEHTFTVGREDPPGDLARSYDWVGSWRDVSNNDSFSFAYGAGDMASSAGDLLSWARTLATGAMLEEETSSEQLTCVDVDGHPEYGLAVACDDLPDFADPGTLRGHAGAFMIAVSQLWYSETWDSSAVLLINHQMHGTALENHADWLRPIVTDLFEKVGEHR